MKLWTLALRAQGEVTTITKINKVSKRFDGHSKDEIAEINTKLVNTYCTVNSAKVGVE